MQLRNLVLSDGMPLEREVIEWRQSLETEFTCEYFDCADTGVTIPNVLPAITRRIIDCERAKTRRSTYLVLSIMGSLLILVGLFSTSATFRVWCISMFVHVHDPLVFNHARDARYNVVRLVDGGADLKDNTSFRDELLATRVSLKLFANTFEVLQTYFQEFKTLAARGVKIQLVFTDFSESNRSTWGPFHQAIGTIGADKTLSWARENTYPLIKDLVATYPNVAVKTSSQAVLYSMWLRDDDVPDNALAHLRVSYYGTPSSNQRISDWPSFRFSATSGAGQVSALRNQFAIVWDLASEFRD